VFSANLFSASWPQGSRTATMDRTFRGFARPNPELPNDSLAMELAIYAGGSFVYSVRRSQGSDFGMEVR
jgi:hypothetical protein